MRLAYAMWLVEWIEEHGISLEKGEYAEWEAAEFRVYGTARLPRAEVLPIRSDLAIDEHVLNWEPDVLAGMAHELIGAIVAAEKNSDDDGP